MRLSVTSSSLFRCVGALLLLLMIAQLPCWLPSAAAEENHDNKEHITYDELTYDGDDGFEPPVNVHLMPRSPWPMTHRNPYCQQSTPWPGPAASDELDVEFLFTAPGTSTVIYDDITTRYYGVADSNNNNNNNGTVLWTHNPFHTGRLLRPSRNDKLRRLDAIGNFTLDVLSGAYYFLDRAGVLYAARAQAVRAFAGVAAESSGENDKPTTTSITKLREFAISTEDDEKKKRKNDSIVGLNLLYDGYLVYTTARGVVGVLRREDFGEHYSLRLQVAQQQEEEEEESISNMMAVDEDGGIFIVTSAKLYRVQWHNSADSSNSNKNKSLTVAWSSAYDSGPRTGGRLGEGSGTTPTLMGTGSNDHKLVLITDAAPLMHLLVYWRDAIPDDWQPLAPGLDRRLAARVPLRFGHPGAAKYSNTEQSVVVRGYGALVVNNDYGPALRNWPSWTPDLVHQMSVLLTNLPGIAPYGLEKFEWNVDRRQLERSWVNRDVSCPNGVPAMSAASNLAYCIGQRHGQWNLEAVDWTTGESVFFKPSGYLPIYNSAFSCLIIGMDREILSGGMAGITRFKVKASTAAGSVEDGSDVDENHEDSPVESSDKEL